MCLCHFHAVIAEERPRHLGDRGAANLLHRNLGALHRLPVVADENHFCTPAELAKTGPIRFGVRVANNE